MAKLEDAFSWGCGFLLVAGFFTLYLGWQPIAGHFVGNDIAVKALEIEGFTNVKIVSKDYWWVNFKGGDTEDDVMFTAQATNAIGKQVIVHVYVGWPWKGATIREPH